MKIILISSGFFELHGVELHHADHEVVVIDPSAELTPPPSKPLYIAGLALRELERSMQDVELAVLELSDYFPEPHERVHYFFAGTFRICAGTQDNAEQSGANGHSNRAMGYS